MMRAHVVATWLAAATLGGLSLVSACSGTERSFGGEGAGGQSTSSETTECTPGESASCYDGPKGTEGQGICKGGKKLCGVEGMWSACDEQVLPEAPNCKNGKDNDCDGNEDLCSLDTLWSKGFPDSIGVPPKQVARSLARDSHDNIVLLGEMQGIVDFGCSPPAASTDGNNDLVVAKFAPDGKCVWSSAIGGADAQYASKVVVDPADNIYVSGSYNNTVDFHESFWGTNGGFDFFVFKMTPDGQIPTGTGISYGGNGNDSVHAIAVNQAGQVFVAGAYASSDFTLKGALPTPTGSFNSFLMKALVTGEVLWSKPLIGGSSFRSLAVDSKGDLIIAGTVNPDLQLDDLHLETTELGDGDVFIIKVSGKDGTWKWAKQFGDALWDVAWSVAVDESDDVIVAGEFSGLVDFGGPSPLSAPDRGVFVAKYTGDKGKYVFAKGYTSLSTDYADGQVALGTDGSIFVAGAFGGDLTFGGATFSGGTENAMHLFLAKLDEKGNHLTSRGFGTKGNHDFGGLVVDSSNHAILFADTDFGVNFGKGFVGGDGTGDTETDDLVLVKFVP